MKPTIDAKSLKELKVTFHAIVKCVNESVENQYGHHVIQHLLECADTDITDTIFKQSEIEVKEHIQSTDMRASIVGEVLSEDGDLISDKCGNYRLQSALIAFQPGCHLFQEFASTAQPHVNLLRKNDKSNGTTKKTINLVISNATNGSYMSIDGISGIHIMGMNNMNSRSGIKEQMGVQLLLNGTLYVSKDSCITKTRYSMITYLQLPSNQ